MKMKLKNLKFKMLKKNKLLFWDNQKLMKLKKIKYLYPQRKRKMINMVHHSSQQKNIDIVDKEDRTREMWLMLHRMTRK